MKNFVLSFFEKRKSFKNENQNLKSRNEKLKNENEKLESENKKLKEMLERTSSHLLLLTPISAKNAIDMKSGDDIFIAKKKFLFEKACKTISAQDKVFLGNMYCYLRFMNIIIGMNEEASKKYICNFFTFLIPLTENSLKYIAEFELHLQAEIEREAKL